MDDLVRRRMDTLFAPERPEHRERPVYPDYAEYAEYREYPAYPRYRERPGARERPGDPDDPDDPNGQAGADASVPGRVRHVAPVPPPALPPRAEDPLPPPASGPLPEPRAVRPRHRPRPPLSERIRSLLPLAVQERLDLDRRAVVGLSVLLVLALGYGVQHFWAGRPVPIAVPAAAASAASAASGMPGTGGIGGLGGIDGTATVASAATAGPTAHAIGTGAAVAAAGGVVVDVAGRVHAPGVRTLRPGSRVQDALRAAGGALRGTDLTGLNLARIVNDGEEIVVGVPAGAAAAPGPAGAGPAASGPLSLNTATADQLDALPGLGPVLVQRIIQFRDQHGGFRSVDQLGQISGFGERRLKDLHALLRP